jgi:hypothetical protein
LVAILGNSTLERRVMRLRFLGKHSTPGSSPTLWGTDEKKYVIMGFVLDPDAVAQVGYVPPGEAVVWVPEELMRYLPPEARHFDVTRRPENPAPGA